jgi:hypothetical protein
VRDAEVDEHGVAVQEQNVGGLDVAVHDPGRVDRRQGLREHDADAGDVRDVERPLGAHPVLQRAARDEPGGQIRAVALEICGEDLGDVRRPDPAQRLDLAPQPGACLRVRAHVVAQDLERDRPALLVQGEVDDAHAAFPDPVHEPVRAEERGVTRRRGSARPEGRHRLPRVSRAAAARAVVSVVIAAHGKAREWRAGGRGVGVGLNR